MTAQERDLNWPLCRVGANQIYLSHSVNIFARCARCGCDLRDKLTKPK
jgi:hypothetical protein